MSYVQQKARRVMPLWWLVAIALVLISMMALLALRPVFATHGHESVTGSDFEIDHDANLRVDDAGNIDWQTAFDDEGFGNVVKFDQPSGSGDDSFGQGAKEDTACPTVVSGSIPPNKSDLLAFGIYVEEGAGTAGAGVLHLFWTRVQEPSGSTNMDFEFNKSSILCENGVTPLRTEGDLLIQYDLVSGGSSAILSKRTWTGTAWGPATELSNGSVGSINSSTIPSGESGGLGALSPRTFGEASIDLAVVFEEGECTSFGSAYLKSRSSHQFNSALKDFIAPRSVDVSNCADVTVEKVDDAGNPLEGVVFTLFEDEATSIIAKNEDGDELSCTTDADGKCSFGAVLAGVYWIDETGGLDGYNADPALPHEFEVFADTDVDLKFENPRQRGRIVILKVDEEGNSLDGAEFTIKQEGMDDIVMADEGGGLFCTDKLLFGEYTVTESQAPDGFEPGDDETVTVDTEAVCADVDDGDADVIEVENTRILHRLIVITCGGDGKLVVSAVSVDGGDAVNTFTTAPAGTTEAALCAITTGASFDLAPDTYDVKVELPKQ